MSAARIATVTMKTNSPREVARFWRELLGYRIAPNHSNSVKLVGDDGPAGDEGWVVMADPGGNLFCVLQARADHQVSLANDPGTATSID
jgi:hypothetical protein